MALHGQQRDRPGRQEMFLCDTVMGPFVFDGANDADLAIAPFGHADAGRCTGRRAPSVGGDGKDGPDDASGVEHRDRPGGSALERGDLPAVVQGDAGKTADPFE